MPATSAPGGIPDIGRSRRLLCTDVALRIGPRTRVGALYDTSAASDKARLAVSAREVNARQSAMIFPAAIGSRALAEFERICSYRYTRGSRREGDLAVYTV